MDPPYFTPAVNIHNRLNRTIIHTQCIEIFYGVLRKFICFQFSPPPIPVTNIQYYQGAVTDTNHPLQVSLLGRFHVGHSLVLLKLLS